MTEKPQRSSCEIKNNASLSNWYEEEYPKFSKEIRDLNLAKPALRALINEGVYNLTDLKKKDIMQLKQLHGIGKNALAKLSWLLD